MSGFPNPLTLDNDNGYMYVCVGLSEAEERFLRPVVVVALLSGESVVVFVGVVGRKRSWLFANGAVGIGTQEPLRTLRFVAPKKAQV